jgi:hypothetical protein
MIKKALPWSLSSWNKPDHEKLQIAIENAEKIPSPPKWLESLIKTSQETLSEKKETENA